MKTTHLMAAALAFAATASFAMPQGWTDDFDAAKEKAAREGKLLLVDFSGSDWCGWCKKLDSEVFAKPEFVEAAEKDFVLVMIDSPHDKSKLSEKAKKQNPKLTKEYGIHGFPTVLIMDSTGKRLRKTGYRRGGPEAYLKELASLKKSIDAGEDPEAEERAKKAAREAMVKQYWTDDFDAAKERAAKEGKLLLVDFSGSDWCGWCMRLDDEVFSKKEFIEAAQKEYVLVLIDSPRDESKLSEKAKVENPKLTKKYNVRGFPTVLLMDAEGNVVGKTGYERGGAEAYLKNLAKVREEGAKRAAFEKDVKALGKGGEARLSKIDEFLGGMDEDDLEEYEEYVNELLENDKDGKFAKKYPVFAYVKPLEKKMEAAMDALQRDFGKRAEKLGEDASEEQQKALLKEFVAVVKAKFAELKKEAEEVKAKVPEAAKGLDELTGKMDMLTSFLDSQANGADKKAKKPAKKGKKAKKAK